MSSVPRIAIAIAIPRPPAASAALPRVPARQRRRAPAVPIAIAFAAGIVIDRWIGGVLPLWLMLMPIALGGWFVFWRRAAFTRAALCLLLAALLTGAGWHHLRWSVVRSDHVATFAGEQPRPVRVRGRLLEQPTILPPQPQEMPVAIPQLDRSLCTLACDDLISGETVIPVSGSVRLEVNGPLVNASVGDLVDVVGQFSRPRGPQNPGEFDFAEYLRTSGVRAIVRCAEPDDVRVKHAAPRSWRRWQSGLRAQAERLLAKQLSRRTAPVGTALLLGTRSGISDELRTAFAESGTMHILAISGANVGILAGLVWFGARVVGCSQGTTAVVVWLGILGYSLLADSQPPVLRAVLMFSAVLMGKPWFRTTPLINGLALAALGVFVWNPAHLFDTGAQLSFLAVAALIWAPSWIPSRWSAGPPAQSPAEGDDRAWSTRALSFSRRWFVLAGGTLLAIWLFTLPLTMARFHLFSPVGLIVNLLAAPLVVVVLWSGYALLIVGLLVPVAGIPFAFVFDAGLRLLVWLVEESAALEWGHMYLPGPGGAWLAGYYGCLVGVACGVRGDLFRRWGWKSLLTWVVAGLAWGLYPRDSGELRCTFLAVGHGLAVLVELPGGRTLLYDAGQLQNGRRAGQIVQGVLWERGLTRVDALVISHADIDHFNGVPGLIRMTPLGEALFHPSFLDFEQESVRIVTDRLAARGIPMRTIGAGDRLMLDGRVAIRVRHPGLNERDPLDNANSLVLEIEYAGRKILLTGDLEKRGLQRLLEQPPAMCDVLLAPHHGSLSANTHDLAAWSAARWVTTSAGRSDPSERLRRVYEPLASVFSTAECGAVTVVIGADGDLQCRPFHQPVRH
ncbi:MAG: ComEC family competence protein [Planctomycetaceae bacterium]|nr:ComEC family competence protein [Planctomycetaceae bacterium]